MDQVTDRASTTADQPKLRGFQALSPERVREIASQGGRAAQAGSNPRRFTPEEAKAAGRLGGQAVSADREHMREIGRRGGKVRGERQ